MGCGLASVRSPGWQKLIKSEPRLLALRGQMNESALKEERITREGVHAAVRSAGHSSLADVEAVVLETDGGISVIASDPKNGDASALRGLGDFSAAG